jgi:transcription initiation factor TFIIIB Brf1 subunit/transcription initiation factor TFIIB
VRNGAPGCVSTSAPPSGRTFPRIRHGPNMLDLFRLYEPASNLFGLLGQSSAWLRSPSRHHTACIHSGFIRCVSVSLYSPRTRGILRRLRKLIWIQVDRVSSGEQDLRYDILKLLIHVGEMGESSVAEDRILEHFRRRASAEEIRAAISSLQRAGEARVFKSKLTHTLQVASTSVLSVSGRLCPECGSLDIITDSDRGETVCTRCGLQISDNNTVPSFARTSPPRGRLVDDSMSLIASLPSRPQRRPQRARPRASLPASVGLRAFLVRDRKMWQHTSLVELDRVCQKVGASRVLRNETARLYLRLVKYRRRIRRDRTSLMTALLLAAYRMHGYAMPVKQICVPGREKPVLAAYRKLRRLGIFWASYVTPISCLDRILSRVKIELASELAPQAEPDKFNYLRTGAIGFLRYLELLDGTGGRSPYVVASLAIYEASKRFNVPLSLRVIGKAAYVRPETISRLRASLRCSSRYAKWHECNLLPPR